MTTQDEIAAFRQRLSFGEHISRTTVLNHPTSGEGYAVIVAPDNDALLWAAGPLGKDDDPQAFIDNQIAGDMVDDADWLSDQLDTLNGWGALNRRPV